jgi:predicted ArsR family transcriptional regulator
VERICGSLCSYSGASEYDTSAGASGTSQLPTGNFTISNLDQSINSTTGLSVLSEVRRAMLTLLKRHGEATGEQLAHTAGLSASGARQQLVLMAAEGLISYRSLPAEGPGRRPHVYRLAPAGEALFPVVGLDLALRILGRLAEASPELFLEAMNEETAGNDQVYEQALGKQDSLSARLDALQGLTEGRRYITNVEACGEESGSVEYAHCPLWPLAERFPVVCELEKQLLTQSFPGYELQVVQQRRDGANTCKWTLRRVAHGAPS